MGTSEQEVMGANKYSRHAALLSRIALLVQGNDNKLSSFRSAVRQFKNNESSAKDMIDTIFNVLDRDVESTVGVLREVAGLFDDDEKSRAVLEAVNGFRIEVSHIPLRVRSGRA